MKQVLTVYLLFTLTIQVTQIRDATGSIRLALYQSEDSWMEPELAQQQIVEPAKKGNVTFIIKGLKKGTYGYALFHDANDNKKIDMQWLPPKPEEGVGASNNAEGIIGPPNWEDSQFSLHKDLFHSVHMTYM